jgi:hypothetical protein
MTTGLIVTVAVLAPLAVMCWMVYTAPLGWEDSDGWHPGEPPEHSDYDGDAQ